MASALQEHWQQHHGTYHVLDILKLKEIKLSSTSVHSFMNAFFILGVSLLIMCDLVAAKSISNPQRYAWIIWSELQSLHSHHKSPRDALFLLIGQICCLDCNNCWMDDAIAFQSYTCHCVKTSGFFGGVNGGVLPDNNHASATSGN